MKNIIAVLSIFVLMISYLSTQTVAQDFEGTIYFEASDLARQGVEELPYMIKGSKARIEFGQGQQKGAMLMLPEESRMVIIIDAMQGYMSMDLDDARDEAEDFSNTEASKTGETKSIAGKDCEVWKIETNDEVIESCMAAGMGSFMLPESPMQQNNTPDWAKELIAQGAMPLEVIEIKNGNRSIQMRATRIEEESLADDLFEIPEGYNDMSGMMEQM